MIYDSSCNQQGGLKPAVWVPGWERTLHKPFGRAIAHAKPSAPTLNTVIDGVFGQVSRALDRKDSGPAAFNLLLQGLIRQFNRGETRRLLSANCRILPLRGLLPRFSNGSFWG